MKSGWRHDSYRHSLAARGIKTSQSNRIYAAPKQPFTIKTLSDEQRAEMDAAGASPPRFDATPPIDSTYDEVLSERRSAQIRASETARLMSGRKYERALNLAQTSGEYRAAIELINNPAKYDEMLVNTGRKVIDSTGAEIDERVVDSDKVAALRSALNARALQNAQAGIGIDKDLKAAIDPDVAKRAETIQSYRAIADRREFESPLKKQMREQLTPAVTAAAITAAPEGIAQAEAAFLGNQSLDAYGRTGYKGDSVEDFDQTSNKLKRSAFVKDNAAIGWEEQAQGGFWDDLEGTRLRSSWDKTLQGGGGVNPILNTPSKTNADVVQARVDSMFDNKSRLSEVDFTPYEKAKKHFEAGDREALINDILDMQKQEAKLKNTNKFVDQLMADMNSKENYADAFDKTGSSNFLLGGSKGAEKLNDQVNKIHDVKGEVAKRYAEAFTRRRLMQQDLVRLDSQIAPRSDIPTTAPITVGDKKRWWEKTPNPVIDGARANPVVDSLATSKMINRGSQ